MSIQFTNDATTFLAANINASVTTITVVDASSFPTLASGDHTYITLSTPTNSTKEIVKCTAIVGNTLTVIRAQEGTTAASFTTDDRAQIRITAQLFRDIMLAYASLNSYRYTATAGQTTFTGTDIHSATLAYLPNNIIVMLNGVGMGTVDYTATDGSSIVFNVGATLNDEITIVAFTAFGVSDHYKKSETDALLAGKVDDSQVLTNVPSGALFTDTDTVYTHPSNHAISVITGLQAALDGKTTESYVNTAVSNLVDSSPATLNTLNELAAALGDDANFSTTTATALGLRVSKDSDTGAASMPTGTTAQRPTGALGMFRHNTTLNQFEGYNDGEWGALAGGGELSKITYEFIATAGQTSFTGSDLNSNTLSYTVGSIIVSYGGLDLAFSDYTATNGSSITLADGAVVGKIVRIVAFTTFAVADTYTQSQADVLLAAKSPLASPSFTGNVGINNSSPTQRLETNGNAQFNAYDNGSGAGGYYTAKGLQIGNAFDAGLSGGDDDRNAIVWNERGTSILFGTTNLERLRIDYAGNVGVGVTPEASYPDRPVVRVGSGLGLQCRATGNPSHTWINSNSYQDASTAADKYIGTDQASQIKQTNGAFTFNVAPSGTADSAISWTTAMTINNTDDVVVGNFTTNGSEGGVRLHYNNYADGSGAIFTSVTNTATRGHFWFYNPNGQVGTITTNGSSTSYNTSSDYRLKENVTPMSGATAQTKLLKPCNFDWIAGGNVNGFLAHELAEVVPEAVSGTKDAMRDEEYEVTPAVLDDEGNETTAAVMGTRSVPDMQGIDQSKLVPLLTATIQELIARIEALEGAAP